jgi:curved DNA-binding protein CbpA
MELYKILELTKEATISQIKKAYRKLSKIHHPDKGGNQSEFDKISKAYKILIDEKKRKQYDEGKPVDDILNVNKNRPLEIISITFMQILYSIDPDRQNIIDIMKQSINSTVENVEREKKKQEELNQKFEKCLKKLKHKNKDNILSQLITDNIYKVGKNITFAEQEISDLKEALEMISEYKYELPQDLLLDYFGIARDRLNISTASF